LGDIIFTRNDTNPASNRKAWTRPHQPRPMRDSVIMKFLIIRIESRVDEPYAHD